MYATRFLRILTPLLVGCLVLLFAVAAPQFHASARGNTTAHALSPTISTNCPAPGKANAAVMPPLTLGTHPTIVYIVNESNPSFGTLKRYDVVTGAKVEIVKMANTVISEAQVSFEGQWLLFVSHVGGQNMPPLPLPSVGISTAALIAPSCLSVNVPLIPIPTALAQATFMVLA